MTDIAIIQAKKHITQLRTRCKEAHAQFKASFLHPGMAQPLANLRSAYEALLYLGHGANAKDPVAFLQFLTDALTAYRCTILRMERFYGAQGPALPPDPLVPERTSAHALQHWPPGVAPPQGPCTSPADVRPLICRCLVALGDLTRYAAPCHENSGGRDLNTAAAYYRAAVALHPEDGTAFNQLAVLHNTRFDITAAYLYFRAMGAPNPFPTARHNLLLALTRNAETHATMLATDAAKQPPSKTPVGKKGAATKGLRSRGPAEKPSGPRGMQALQRELSIRWLTAAGMLFQGIGTERFEPICTRAMSDMREYLQRVASLPPKVRPALPPLAVQFVAVAAAAASAGDASASDYTNAVRKAELRRLGMVLMCSTGCCIAAALQAQLPRQLPGTSADLGLDTLAGSCAAALRLVLRWWVAQGEAALRLLDPSAAEVEARVALLDAVTALAPATAAMVAPPTPAALPEDAMLHGYAPLQGAVEHPTTTATTLPGQDDGRVRLQALLDAAASLCTALGAQAPPPVGGAGPPGSVAAQHAAWRAAQHAACVRLGAALRLPGGVESAAHATMQDVAMGGTGDAGHTQAHPPGSSDEQEVLGEEVIVWQGTAAAAAATMEPLSNAVAHATAASFYQQYEATPPEDPQWAALPPTQALAPAAEVGEFGRAPEHNLLLALQPEGSGPWGPFGGVPDVLR